MRELIEVLSQKIADESKIAAAITAGGFLDSATGDFLTFLSKSVYGVDQILATFGTTSLTLTNSGGVSITLAAGDVKVSSADPASLGKTYESTTGGTVPVGGTLSVTIVADEAGTGSNAGAGTITSFVTPLLGLTCSNPTALVASDAESEEALRVRCRESLAKASPNGPADAYNFFAKTATLTDGSGAGVTRTRVVQNNGSLIVYVASAAGAVAGTFSDPATPLGAAFKSIQDNCVPTGLSASVVSARPLTMSPAATVYLAKGSVLSVADARSLILARLLTYFASLPIGGSNVGVGGRVFLDAIIGEIFQAAPGQIVQVVMTDPLADEPLASSEVAVCASALTDFTILTAVS
jgi:hypothetical protein